MYYVYMLRSIPAPQQTYIGYTTDLNTRLTSHNHGQSKHTAKYKPWELVAYTAFSEQSKALSFEKYLKPHSGKAFVRKRLW
jgi:predicted GIY-YIG superfamily endonuclease